MRAVVVLFILALITVAGEIYSDAALTSGRPLIPAPRILRQQLSRIGSHTGNLPAKAVRIRSAPQAGAMVWREALRL